MQYAPGSVFYSGGLLSAYVYSYGNRKEIDLDLEILLEDFLDRSDLDPVYERIILDKLPPDFDNIYVEFWDGHSRLLSRKQLKNLPEVLEEG